MPPHKNRRKVSKSKRRRNDKMGGSATNHEDGDDTPSVEDASDDETDCPPGKNKDQGQKSKTSSSSRKHYCIWALGLWIFEFIAVIGLKHMGFLTNDFELREAVLDSVRPQLDGLNDVVQTVLPGLNESLESLSQSLSSPEKKSVGYKLAQQGAKANYPVIMVPGFVTSGLEVWAGRECAKGHFRQRLWAAMTGARSFMIERDCWKEHMMLNPYTGEDPDGIRVRAAEGFGATDYFLANYWVFAKVIESLAAIGYDPSLMEMMPYDWRLAFTMLEKRDGFLTKLKYRIEAMHKTTGKKIVLVTHSMGAQLLHHFFAWVTTSEKKGGGGGGRKWVDKHIHTYVNIAGSHLGVPKAATALLSGEMSDVLFTGKIEKVVENFFGRRLRRNLWSTWGSLWAMLPKGGSALWGPGVDMCPERSSNDSICPEQSDSSPLIAMTDSVLTSFNVNASNATAADDDYDNIDLNMTLKGFVEKQTHSTEETLDFLDDYGSGLGPNHVGTKFVSQYGETKERSRMWHDVTRQPLPYAPNMRIFCLYGTGIPTERAYYYKRNWAETASNGDASSQRTLMDPPMNIDTAVSSDERNTSYGIKYSDGDGSVPLISLGYVCADAWRRKDSGLNPSKTTVYTREYLHKSEFSVDDPMRAGPASSDHVDILGNAGMLEDFIKIVSEFNVEEVESDRIVSDILGIAQEINSHPGGGIFKKKKRPW